MTTYKQEMPPKGGFNPIDLFSKKLKKPLNGLILFPALWLSFFAGKYLFVKTREWTDCKVREDKENRLALLPFIIAEQQRLHMKQHIRNKEYETKLMKDVPDWEVGKWYDQPVYHNPRNLWIEPEITEFYAHACSSDFMKRKYIKMYT